jgi:cytochrome P450
MEVDSGQDLGSAERLPSEPPSYGTDLHRVDAQPYYSEPDSSWIVSRSADVNLILQSDAFVEVPPWRISGESFPEVVSAYLREANAHPAALASAEPSARETAFQVQRRLFDARSHDVGQWSRLGADRCIDAFVAAGAGELCQSFSLPFSASNLLTALGVPPELMMRCITWTADASRLPFEAALGAPEGELLRLAGSYVKLRDTFAALPATTRLGARALSRPASASSRTVDESLVKLSILLAGHQLTANLITHVAVEILRVEGMWARLRANLQGVRHMTAEILPAVLSMHALVRVATAEVTISGSRILAGQRVVVVPPPEHARDLVTNVLIRAQPDDESRVSRSCVGLPFAVETTVVALEALIPRLVEPQMVDDQNARNRAALRGNAHALISWRDE